METSFYPAQYCGGSRKVWYNGTQGGVSNPNVPGVLGSNRLRSLAIISTSPH